MTFTKGNTVGLSTRFGDQWQGVRCGAKTRSGSECRRPAYKVNGKCYLHGGASTGPRTKGGLASLTQARTKHGKFTKEKRAAAISNWYTIILDEVRKKGVFSYEELSVGQNSEVEKKAEEISLNDLIDLDPSHYTDMNKDGYRGDALSYYIVGKFYLLRLSHSEYDSTLLFGTSGSIK